MVKEVIFGIAAVSIESSIKLPAIFVQVKLEEPFIHLVVDGFNPPSAIAGYNMNPRQYLSNKFMFTSFCFGDGYMVVYQVVQTFQTCSSICIKLGFFVYVSCNYWIDCF